MGAPQNNMWQQPAPQSSVATNPFAAPSGPSVRNHLLNFFTSSTVYPWANFCFEFSLPLVRPHRHFSFLAPFLSLSSCLNSASTFNPLVSLSSPFLVAVDETTKIDLFTFAYIFFRSE